MKRGFEAVKRIVIKIGTSSLVLPNGKINLAKIDQLAFCHFQLGWKGQRNCAGVFRRDGLWAECP